MAALVALGGLAPQAGQAARGGPKNPEDLLIVDCLLPGQVRKLGAQATFMSARRPIRTTQADCEIRGGEYVSYDRANYQTALQVWMTQALTGSAEAQNYVGEIYLKGLGTPPDHGMAAQWFQKASEQGFARAKTNLAYLYEQGLGVPKDELKALNLYREASGAGGDELLFASAVKVQLEAKDSEISALKQTVEEQRQQADQLRAQVRDLQSQLGSRKQAAQAAQAEVARLQQQLAQARQATGADFAALEAQKRELASRSDDLLRLTREIEAEKAALQRRQEQLAQQESALQSGQGADAEMLQQQSQRLAASIEGSKQRSASLESELSRVQAELAAQRAAYDARIAELEAAAANRNQEDWELMKLLETQLASRETELRNQQLQIVALEQQVSISGGALLAAAPTLEIIDPPLTLTRGKSAAMLRGAPGRHPLVGKVSAPQAVKEITVNGTPVIIGDNGLFRASVDVAQQGSLIQVAAVSRTGDLASIEFTMLPQPGASPVNAPSAGSARGVPAGVKLGRFHALVIGNNSYQSNVFGSLKSAVNDATAVSNLLRDRYGYKTTLLLNASRFDMLSALNDLRQELKPEDNLLVYYAGHGELSEDGKTGYWIPVDGQAGLSNTWISNRAVSDILDTMEAKHVLVVADSCYSGALTEAALPLFAGGGDRGSDWGEWVKTMNDGRARIALTSGGLQPVPDVGTGKHSYFARAFLNVLEDNNRLLEGQALYREITSTLALTSLDAPLTQSPVYAPIQFAGHITGDFFFMPRSGAAAP
ncbi:caspase family protein [Pseudomarimonas salicorniae]|uniref:Caspase family protein n=1 Tax=Pseudomarimonas salicorniae TaxID=2933270 RepID=A0ABT0GFF7_9GAMM|nr:caspase family protein [Lysobacter sp. CAU 1642]MCK7593266.1 caspase family protein [Lysobacter sp. CAU 1642]